MSRGGRADNCVGSDRLGLLIGFAEGWSLGDAVHFTFVAGLILLATISYRGGLAHEKAA